MSIKVLLVHRSGLFCEGLRMLINCHDGMDVIGEADDGDSGVESGCELVPDVAVFQLMLPGINGMDVMQRIRRKTPNARGVVIAARNSHGRIEDILKVGISGFIWEECDFTELVHAIEEVAEGRTYFTPGVAEMLMDQYVNGSYGGGQAGLDVLTSRQREVLQLLADGKSVKEIGFALNISPKTVATHRQDMMSKLDLHCTADITKYAIREGLAEL